MAAHRYWRATAIEAYGAGDLELSEFHLLGTGVRLDAAATLTANSAPDVSGTLASLQDDDLTTAARWSAQAAKRLVLYWDFGGSAVEVDDIRLAGDSELRFALIAKVEWSDDGVTWSAMAVAAGITWPGYRTKTGSYVAGSIDPDATEVVSLLHFSGADNSTVFTDEVGTTWTAVGSPKIKTAQSMFGGSSLYCDQSSYITAENDPKFDLADLDFTVECWVYQTSASGGGSYFGSTYYQNVISNAQIGTPANNGFNLTLVNGVPAASVYNAAGTSDTSIFAASAIPLNTWVHLAYVRIGTALRLYAGGVLVASGSFSGRTYLTTRKLAIGADPAGTSRFAGYVDEAVVRKGRAYYTGPFTPPAEPFGVRRAINIKQNRVKGRSAPPGLISVGAAPAIAYGTPRIALPAHLSVEAGSVKDQLTGVLGQGIGRVRGTVKETGTPNAPLKRRVRLVRDRDGLQVRELWSDPVTGEYDFRYVDELQAWTVVSYDHLNNYRAVVADNLTLANGGVELI